MNAMGPGLRVGGVGLLFVLFATVALPAAAGEPGKPLDCVTHRTEARYGGYGYDHLVHLDNACAQSATCTVSTDVNPEKQRVTVKGRERTTVVTFRGSPAREFRATVECSAAG